MRIVLREEVIDMGHHHDHHHHHHHGSIKNRKLLGIAFSLTIFFSFLEILYGFLSHSLALLSDGIHMTSDGFSLLLGFVAVSIGMRVATKDKTFGYKRFETIAAFVNGLTLIIIPIFVIIEAIKRFIHPVDIMSKEMMVVGILGLTINLIVAYLLSRGDKDNLNVKAAFLHVLSDLFTSVTVILASLCIMMWGITIIDPIVSILTSLVIIRGGVSITKESHHILMEGFPHSLNYEKLYSEIESLPFVESIKDLHVWSISGDDYFATLKVQVTKDYTLAELQQVFENEHIHVTIEVHT